MYNGPDLLSLTSKLTSSIQAAAIEQFGRINLVAPFAGIIKDAMMATPDIATGKVTRKMTQSQFQSVLDINLTGVFLTEIWKSRRPVRMPASRLASSQWFP
jgi:NAD(P)-dependent dehydrogenase (short-subunit alcohol dehydrogenase family)